MTERIGTIVHDALMPRAGKMPAPRVPTSRPSASSNVERLVVLAGELMNTFGYGGFSHLAAAKIREVTNEQTAATALRRIHEESGPPYR